MASAWITTRLTSAGGKRYRVMYRLGGRESLPRYAGSFSTKRDAIARKAWVIGELAALRVPDPRRAESASPVRLRAAGERWRAARVDVSEGTMQTYRVALGRLYHRLGDVPLSEVRPPVVARLVADLHEAGLRKQTIRKTVSVLAMIFDQAGIQPNPARDKQIVRLPREERRHVEPPAAEHVEAVVRLLPRRYRLPALVLDATGMRVGELERLTWETSTSGVGAGASPQPSQSRGGLAGSNPRRRSSRPCARSSRATIASLSGRSSRASAPTVSGPRLLARVPPQACRRSPRTISATGVSRSFIYAACRGPGSASS